LAIFVRMRPKVLLLVWLLHLLSSSAVLESKPSVPLEPLHKSSRKQGLALHRVESKNEAKKEPVHSGIFSPHAGADFTGKVRSQKVVALLKGCGREPNRLAVFEDGSKACCRYRDWEWREVRGEFYSYHFNNLLGLYNAPPAVVLRLNHSSPHWASVANTLRKSKWRDGKVIVMTEFVEGITPEAIPEPFKRTSPAVAENDLNTFEDRERLLQWSDTIVFDFVVGHSDRIFNTLLNQQWYPDMINKNVHNLWKTKDKNKFLLIDNESGFWMGYKVGWNDENKLKLQSSFLEKLCLFRSRTADRVKYLIQGKGESPREKLEAYIKSVDPLSFAMLRKLSIKEGSEFERRLKKVDSRIKFCS